MAVDYRRQLQALDARVLYLMTLYLHPTLTPEEVQRAHAQGVTGVKSYPRGVTTNSDQGIEDYRVYYPVFAEMERLGMILHLHGEVPSDHARDICVMNAEECFLQHLEELHRDFPRLKIVLEHATTAKAVETVKRLGATVGCTITCHHLQLTVDDWAGKPHHFCKPVAKYPHDRDALRQVVAEGHPRFFLGSDSAPHPKSSKECASVCAGVFTSAFLLPTLAHLFESFDALDQLPKFTSEYGRRFYGDALLMGAAKAQNYRQDFLTNRTQLKLVNDPMTIPNEVPVHDAQGKVVNVIVPFMAGAQINWSLAQ